MGSLVLSKSIIYHTRAINAAHNGKQNIWKVRLDYVCV